MSRGKKSAAVCLSDMAGFAAERRSKAVEVVAAAGRGRYVRIGGNGFRAISIDLDRPCGSLERDGRVIPVRKSISRALEDCDASPTSVPVRNSTTPYKAEHRIQAYLIGKALSDQTGFASLIGCEEIFDSLHFVTDELRIDDDNVGAIRADVVALGSLRSTHVWVPVFIEIKVGRDLGRLVEQLDSITKAANVFKSEFGDVLASATGIAVCENDMAGTVRILIFGRTESGAESERVADVRRQGVITVLWKRAGDRDYSFERSL